MGEDDAVWVWVEDVDDGVGLDEGFDLAQDKRPFKLEDEKKQWIR